MDRQVKWHGHRIDPGEIGGGAPRSPGRHGGLGGRDGDSPPDRLRIWPPGWACGARGPVVDGRRRRRLANDLAIVDFRAHETAFTYHAIFEEQTYLKAGIRVDGLSCIF